MKVQAFSNFIMRRAGWVCLFGTLLSFVAAYYSIQLYKNLRTNFEELLPSKARSVLNLNEVQARLRSIDSLGIIIFSQDTNASRRFVEDLAGKIKALPPDVVSSVEYRINKEIQFFKQRQALFMQLEDLKKVRDYIDNRIHYERSLYNPANMFRTGADNELEEPKLNMEHLRGKYSSSLATYDRFPNGYYATPDEKIRAILVYLIGEASNVDQGGRLKDEVVKAIASLNPKSYAPDLEIRFTGGVQDTIEEHDALIEDLELSTGIVMLVVTLAMIFFYRAFRATMALMFSLLVGTLWTFGASYFAVGYLNANSAFLGSIVLGNGINFGIIFLARYLEERRNSCDNHSALQTSMVHTATQTWTAALAAGLSYGSLILTDFRGFRQFGIIGLIGMILCWVSAFTVLPAYLTVMDRWKSLIKMGSRAPRHRFAEGVAWMLDRFPRPIWWLSIAATVISVAMFGRYNSGILETDLSQLRNRHSLESGSAYNSKYLDEIFQRYLSPLAILAHNRSEARQIADLLKKKRDEQGPKSLIATVQTLDDFVPPHQKEKIEVLQQIKKLLKPSIFYKMPEADQKLAKQFLSPEVFKPMKESDLPQMLLGKFTEKNGDIGNLVLVEPPLGKETWQGDKLIGFVQDLRQAADTVSPGVAIAGSLTITADMIAAISRDGPKATLFAFLAVVILVLVLFRNFKTSSLILVSLCLGVLWLAGLILGFWIKINFLNFIALPITFGIGVDYAVNIFERYREEGGTNILKVIRHTGSAVALCSFTTITGYSSLLIASNKAFQSFGLLAVLGEITCLTAALVSIPTYLLLRQRRSEKRPEPPYAPAGEGLAT